MTRWEKIDTSGLIKEIKHVENNKYIAIHPVVEGRIVNVNNNAKN
jgi:hypothetical protein